MALEGFNWGGTIRSTDPNAQGHLEDANMQALFGLQGSKLGDWQWDPARNSRFIDTANGRLYAGDQNTINFANEAAIGGNEYQGSLSNFQALSGGNNLAPYLSGDWQNFGGASIRLGEHANNSGSDAIQGYVDENGVLQFVGMDRESPARRNAILAAIATAGIGGAVAGGVGGASGAFSAGTGAPGALATSGVYGTSVGGATAAANAAANAANTGMNLRGLEAANNIPYGSEAATSGLTNLGENLRGLEAANNIPYGSEVASSTPGLWDKVLDYGSKAADGLSKYSNLIGPALGAVAGAVSGSVDLTNTSTSNSTQTQNRGLVDYAQPAGQAYAGMAQRTINGDFIGQGLGTNPYAGANPYLDQAMDNVARRMSDAYSTGTASQNMGAFAAGGSYGGSAYQQHMANLNRSFADSLGQTLGGMQMQDYTQQQGLAENQLNRQLSQFQGERGLMMGASGGLGHLGSNQTATNNQTNTSTMQGVGPVQGALAGALGGWGMANAYQNTGMLGPQQLKTNVQTPGGGGLGQQAPISWGYR